MNTHLEKLTTTQFDILAGPPEPIVYPTQRPARVALPKPAPAVEEAPPVELMTKTEYAAILSRAAWSTPARPWKTSTDGRSSA